MSSYRGGYSGGGGGGGSYSGYGERKSHPKIHTRLSTDGIRKIINEGFGLEYQSYDHGDEDQEESKEIVVQAIAVRYYDNNLNMKAKLMLSDGMCAVVAVFNHEVFNKMVSPILTVVF